MRGVAPAALLSLLASLPAQAAKSEDFDLGIGLVRRGMFKEAAGHFTSYLKDAPRGAQRLEAWYRLGVCEIERKRWKPARTALQRALREAGSGRFALRAESRYRLGHVLEQLGEHGAAAQQFDTLVEEAGKQHYLAAASLHAAGECHRAAGKTDAALRAYLAAGAYRGEEQVKHAAAALYQAGFLYLRAQDYRQAETQFATAAGLFPEDAAQGECRYLEGESALRGRRFEAAAKAFNLARREAGDFVDDATFGLASCYQQQGRADDALETFDVLLSRHPGSPLCSRARLEIGRLHHEAGRQKSAAQALQALLAGKPEPALRGQGEELMGLVLLAQNQPGPAVGHLRRAMQAATRPADKARISYSLGDAHADQGAWQDAGAAYRRSAELASDGELQGEAKYGEILALHRQGDFKQSDARARAFLGKHGAHRLAASVRFARGENLFALEQYEAALAQYRSVMKDAALAGKASFKAAWCQYLGDDKQAAAAAFARLAQARDGVDKALIEEAAAMVALSWLEAGQNDAALRAADAYRKGYPRGRFLARNERVAARVLRQQGKLKAAASRMARAAASAGSKGEAGADQLEFAELQFQRGDFKAAAKVYAELAGGSDEVGAQALEGLAWCQFELGEDAACAQSIERALSHGKLGGRRAQVLELASALAHRREDWQAAQQAARRFLAECKGHARAPELRYALGLAQARAGEHKAAVATFAEVAADKLERPDRLHYEWAWALRRDGQDAAALQAFARVVQSSKDRDLRGEALLHLGEAGLEDKQNHTQALQHLAKVQGRHEGRARYLIGYHHFEKGEWAPARQAFEHILGLEGAGGLHAEARFFAGSAAARAGQHREACPHFRALLEQFPRHERVQPARLQYGQSLLATGDAATAQAQLAEYLRQAPETDKSRDDRARARLALGQAALAQQQVDAALRAFTTVTAEVENDLAAAAQWHIGRCHEAKGDQREAAAAYVKLSILYGHEEWVPKGLLAAGECYLRLEQEARCRRLLGELIQRFPKSAEAKKARSRLAQLKSM